MHRVLMKPANAIDMERIQNVSAATRVTGPAGIVECMWQVVSVSLF